MKFKKITKKFDVVRLSAKHPHGSLTHIYYEAWDKDKHYGSIIGSGDKKLGLAKEWKFRAVAQFDSDNYIPSLNYEQLMAIVIKICQLNKKSGIPIKLPEDY